MAIETETTKKAADEGSGEGGNQAVKEEILSEQTENVDVEAESTIRSFVRDRLDDFNNQMETALGSFEGYLASQPEEFQAHFNQRGFFDYLGNHFIAELVNLVGGPGLPMMDALAREVDSAVSFAEHAEFDTSGFINLGFRRGVRDACWYARDACTSILANEWGNLLSLAANGSEEFIPALYQLGLPSSAFNPAAFADALKNEAEVYRLSIDMVHEEVTDKEAAPAEQKAAIEEQAQKDMINEEEKKQTI